MGYHRLAGLAVATLVTTLAGGSVTGGAVDAVGTAARFNKPSGLAITSDSSVAFVADYDNHMVRAIDLSTGLVSTVAGTGSAVAMSATASCATATFNAPSGLVLTADNSILCADAWRFEPAVPLLLALSFNLMAPF